jgi:hypothetical protein
MSFLRPAIVLGLLGLGVLVGAAALGQTGAARKPAARGKAGPVRKGRPPAPAQTWKEHWFEHAQVVKLVDSNADAAIYFDDDVPRDATTAWIAPFMTRAWRYTKATYGVFGPDERLYAIFHQGRYGGGHPSTYFDASHDHCNVTDCGPGPWDRPAYGIPSHEIGHIVEGASDRVHGSPAFGLWKDSKWIELYQYDLYVGLGLEDEARSAFDRFTAQSDDFPRPGTHWFRDFFHPAWRDHGRSKLMANFFRLLARHYPKGPEGDGQTLHYTREMNWGEFFHFMSGAAGQDLRPLAPKAFGWPSEWENQYAQARAEFPEIRYAAGGESPSHKQGSRNQRKTSRPPDGRGR